MPGYTSSGYVYEQPVEVGIEPRVVTDDQAQAELRAFSQQLNPLPWAPEKWRPYLDIVPDVPAKVELTGLQVALDHYAPIGEPVAAIITGQNGPRGAVVGDLDPRSSLSSCYRKPGRGVKRLSLTAFLATQRHDIITGDKDGIVDINTVDPRIAMELALDWFDYLPHIDDTLDYTVRHRGLAHIAVAGAVRPVLREHGFSHLWEQYTKSAR